MLLARETGVMNGPQQKRSTKEPVRYSRGLSKSPVRNVTSCPCAKVAELTLKLKGQYQAVLMASQAYGRDQQVSREMDSLGLLVQELEAAVVVLQITLDDDVRLTA